MRRSTGSWVVIGLFGALCASVPAASPAVADDGGPTVVDVAVATGADDVEELNTGYPLLDSSDLELVDAEEGPGQTVGLRFTGTAIPRYATITEAWVQFTIEEPDGDPTALTIAGELADSAAPFTSTPNSVSSRARTSATVPWSPDPWVEVGGAGALSRTPDLTAIVQELVDQPGWSPSSALALVLSGSGHRTAAAEEHEALDPPRLHIAYQPPPAELSVDARVGSAVDDAEQAPSGVVTRSSGDLEMSYEPDALVDQVVGVRFANLDLPRGAVIRRAWIQFTVDEVQADPTTLTISAHDVDNAPKLGPSNFNLTSRNPTAATVTWTPPPWTQVGAAGAAQRTPNLRDMIQEVVDRPYWVGRGGALAFTIRGTGHRTAVAYDLNPNQAPALHIDYLPGTPASYAPETTRYAVVGDYGNGNTGEGNVANLVNSLGVDQVLTTGDNSYGSNPVDENVGRHWEPYIGNLNSAYGTGATTNRFWPSLGNHDYTDGGGLNAYRNYFTLPGNERYYDVLLGPVHVFAVNSNYQEPDGTTADSVQGRWLRDAVAASPAPWQVVILHHSPFSSGLEHGSDPKLQWPFAAWGVDAVFSGHDHDYERNEVDGTPYVVTGLGGASRYLQGPVNPYSVYWTNAADGALIVDACAGRMDLSFRTTTGVTLDTRRLGGPTCAVPTVDVTATGATASEGGAAGELTVTRTGETNRPLLVRYTLSGTASAADVGLTGAVTIPAGADHVALPVPAVDDARVEDDESLTVTLTDAADLDVGTGTADLTIRSDDVWPTVTVAATDADAAEPADTGTFTLTRTGATTDPLTVAYTVGGTAGVGDYTALTGSAVIPAGSATRTVTVSPTDDTLVEDDETVELTLTDGAAWDVGSPGTATVTLHSDDRAPVTVDMYPTEHQRLYGVVQSGNLASLRLSDNNRLVLREQLGNSNPPNSMLESRFVIPTIPDYTNLTVVVEAHHSVNGEGDDLLIDWSRNDGPWRTLVAVTKTADNGTAQFKLLPSWIQPGDVVSLRVRDANRTPGRRQFDTASLDRLFLRALVPG